MTVMEQILTYMTDFLERSSTVFSNMPPCPYAKKERLSNKIYFLETELTEQGPSDWLLEEIRQFDQNQQWSTMLAYAPKMELDVQSCYDFAQRITDALTEIDILAIPLHPDDPFSVQGLRTRQVPCVMMLVQRRDFLSNAKDKLLKTKYYDNWLDQDGITMTQINQHIVENGAFFPIFWWTDNVLKDVQAGAPFPEIVFDSTVTHLTINDLHLWMHKWGELHGWKPWCSFLKWKTIGELPDESIVLATAHGGPEPGFAAVLNPKQSLRNDCPTGFPSVDRWNSCWPGGAYIWIYEQQD